VTKARIDQINRQGSNVDANPMTVKLLSGVHSRATTRERVEHDIILVAASLDDPCQQSQRLLGRVAQALGGHRINGNDVRPE